MSRVLVDTSVWSLALRKKSRSNEDEKVISYLGKIIRELRLVIVGPIRQEILSGISDQGKFEELRSRIAVFVDHEVTSQDYELAAKFSNECRRNGIQGSHTDFLICAVAHNNNFAILTLDKDFRSYQEYVGIKIEEGKDV